MSPRQSPGRTANALLTAQLCQMRRTVTQKTFLGRNYVSWADGQCALDCVAVAGPPHGNVKTIFWEKL